MTEFLESLSATIASSGPMGPLLAILAGFLTSFSPCCLSTIPLVIGYVGSAEKDNPKRAFRLSLMYVAGSALTFSILGVVAASLGRLIGAASSWWYILLGVLMVVMALQTWGLFEIIPSSYLTAKNTRKGYLGAFITGILGGIFSSPCSTPVLIALLAVVAGEGNPIWGGVLLLFYSLGYGILAVVAGTSIGFVKKITSSPQYGKVSNVLRIVSGLLILGLGFYMFYLGF